METLEIHRGRLIDHIQLVVRDLPASQKFYTAIFTVLNIPLGGSGDGYFWADEVFVSTADSVAAQGVLTGRYHLAFQAQDQVMVDAFYQAALAHGGRDNGAPGMRPYHPGYYGAFVLEKWKQNDIGFHESAPNPQLVKYYKKLSLPRDSRVFLPLCGKTLDISWLLAQGCRVAGAELSSLAIQQLFAELGVKPEITNTGTLEHHSARNIDIYVGDIFSLTGKVLGPVDAIYDRAALVALPEATRRRYTAHLMEITDSAPQLLITYEYDQSQMNGPPYSVSNVEVSLLYGNHYDLTLLASTDVAGGIKGKCAAKENVWLLK
jgi:thiopurine S-methyltransferase